MKKTLFIALSISLSIALFALNNYKKNIEYEISSPKNSGGASGGKTGAPGEQNCTACHSGSTQDGSSQNILKVFDGSTEISEYTPGQTYNVTLELASNPSKKGFQATALSGSNAMAGQFFSGSNTQVNTANNRSYANHTISSNSSATTSWSWTWTAPNQGSGDITFYVASNEANNNGANSGDVIYLSQHSISEQSNANLSNADYNPGLKLSSMLSGRLTLNFELNKSSNIGVNIIDMNGRSVYAENYVDLSEGKNSISIDFSNNTKGIYVLHMFIDNKAHSLKFNF